MQPNTSPLDHLTAFAIVFATGILAAATVVTYVERARRNAVRDHYKRASFESKSQTISSARIKDVQ